MKDNELDDLLREKANNIDDSKFNFKMDVNEIKKQAEAKKKNNILRISFASALAACLVLGALFFILKYQSPKEDNITIQGNEDNEKDKEDFNIKANDKVETFVYSKKNIVVTDELPTNIALVTIDKISSNGFKEGIPNMKLEVTINDNLIGNINGNVEIELDSCICKISDIDSIDESFSLNTDDYVRLVLDERMKNIAFAKEGVSYIVSLNENNKVINRCVYPFYEYDPETKKVKIGEEWQDIDFNYIVW